MFFSATARALSLLAFSLPLAAQVPAVLVWQDTISLPTYHEGPPESPTPPFDQLGLNGNIYFYPYSFRVNLSAQRSVEQWRVLHLENEHLHCRILPDLGGHVYSCIDKRGNREMFFANTAIKKATMAPRGAWAALGIETSFPVAHSRVTVSPVHFASGRNPDGSATVFVGGTDRTTGAEWAVAYSLHPGVAALEQKITLHNRGRIRQPFQWWSNAAIRVPEGGVRFIFPMHVTEKHGTSELDTWPVNRLGHDLSNSRNYTEPVGLFAYQSREPFFAVHDPAARAGVAHWADAREAPGKKIWSWGAGPNLRYQNQLSDDRSAYVEIQAGLLPSQDQFEFLAPQQTRTVTEWWIPVWDTGGVSRANPSVILFLEKQKDSTARLDVAVTRPFRRASLVLYNGADVVYRQTADLSPAAVFHAATPALPAGKLRFELKDASGAVLLAHEDGVFEAALPGEARLGLPVKETRARRSEDDFVAAGEAFELKRFYHLAAEEYSVGLQRFPKSAGLRRAEGRLELLFGDFAAALKALAAAHEAAPADAETSYYLGVVKSLTGDDAAARPLWEAASSAPGPIGSAARFELAAARARAKDLEAAARMFRDLAAAGARWAAGALEVALLRRTEGAARARSTLDGYLAVAPFDPHLRIESEFLGRKDASLWEHLAADPEWVLDIVDQYFRAGLYEGALALLERRYPAVPALQMEPGAVPPHDYPLIAYYRGYARERLGNSGAADYQAAQGQSTRFVYPYRFSSFPVLEAALRSNPEDSTARYLLGCLLMNARRTDAALAEWEEVGAAGARIPGFYDTVSQVLTRVKRDPERSRKFVADTLASDGANPELQKLAAAAPAPPPAPAVVIGTPEDTTRSALALAASGRAAAAAGLFTAQNFPAEKQPEDVRRTYVEIALQNILATAKARDCRRAQYLIEGFGQEVRAIPFTFYSFAALLREPRAQFYLALARAACGQEKDARKIWEKVAKAAVTPGSPDSAFPLAAAALLGSDVRTRLETALETVRGGVAGDPGLALYAEGILLRAAGRSGEAMDTFSKGMAVGSTFARYLNAAAMQDPPFPVPSR